MDWIVDAAGQFHSLMQRNQAFMEQELATMAGWVGMPDKKTTTEVIKEKDQQVDNLVDSAIEIYGNRRGLGNGPVSSGDGWKFRGRGIFQLTGRNNYTKFNLGYKSMYNDNSIDFLAAPDKVCEFPYYIRSAVWFWVENRIYLKADSGANNSAVDAVTLPINGEGMHAAAERRLNFNNLTYPAFR